MRAGGWLGLVVIDGVGWGWLLWWCGAGGMACEWGGCGVVGSGGGPCVLVGRDYVLAYVAYV